MEGREAYLVPVEVGGQNLKKVHRRSRSESFSVDISALWSQLNSKFQLTMVNWVVSGHGWGHRNNLISSFKFSSRTHPPQRQTLANTHVWVL